LKIKLPNPPKEEDLDHFKEDFLCETYRRMYQIRSFELRVNELFLKGQMPGTIHLSHGQEAVSVGACMALRADDIITLTHRGHGQALAKGVSPRALMAELFGKSTGCCRGKGGSLHIGDMAVGAFPAIAIIGASSPIAAGLAFAFKRRGCDRIVCNFHGDGAVNKGDWHEAMNLTAIWGLPVIFLCENNFFGVSTHISDVILNEQLSERANAYRVFAVTIFGNDPIEVYREVAKAAERVRKGQGPVFIEALTYRQGGHKRDDPATYRDQEEVQAWLKQDPVTLFRERILIDPRISDEEICALEKAVQKELDDAVDFALSSPKPPIENALEDVYA